TMSLSSPPLLLLSATLHPSLPTLFPYTTLFRSHVAFAAPPSDGQGAAGPEGLHGRADGGAVVDSQVGPVELEDGVKPRPAEMRGDPGPEFQRRPQKHLLQRLPVGRVICRTSACIVKEQRL